ncbi:hypothetical protein [Streptomyces sp. 5-10]|uniref:hypothetical protein n=1 Tax=Streptomyces sp. 5-10 TaxID=878925 RepID=UPI00168B5575|nr:hypothetical protein [Streptomyces sp. 5-10]MBD3004528.1 hypothetical protein [Streptomyces sp. 5-10]
MSGVHVVSLVNKEPQVIASGGYQLLRFPFEGESYDRFGMHDPVQPDGGKSEFPDDRSGLIWPSREGWGQLEANIHWEAAPVGGVEIPGIPDWLFKNRNRYCEVRDRFVRDPLNLVKGEQGDEGAGGNATGTDHRVPSPGLQAFTKQHGLFVHRGVPVGLMVAHDAKCPVRVVHAQLKLTIWPVAPKPKR